MIKIRRKITPVNEKLQNTVPSTLKHAIKARHPNAKWKPVTTSNTLSNLSGVARKLAYKIRISSKHCSDILGRKNIQIVDCRGQSYDNASNKWLGITLVYKQE